MKAAMSMQGGASGWEMSACPTNDQVATFSPLQ